MKSSTGTTSRRTVGTTGQRSERTSSRRSGNDSKPLRRTPGTEEDDEIANYLVEVPVAENNRTKDPAASVAGTEHQSIVEKMDWRQMKGLYDLVIKQKDEASRGSSMVIDASRFGGSDNVSDLSDNTSREPLDGDSFRMHPRAATAAPAPPLAGSQGGSRRQGQGQPQLHSQGSGHSIGGPAASVASHHRDAETEYISNIVNLSDSLSVNALEGLVSYLSQVLHVKCRESETSHLEGQNNSDEMNGKDRRSTSMNMSPDNRQTPQELPQTSPYMLSQSAPSSFFAGAAPLGVAAPQNAANNSANNSANKRASPYRGRDSGPVRVPPRVDDTEDEDEEIKSLSSNNNADKHGHGPATSTTPVTPRRNMSTPSPKPRRSFTSTPTRTPPMRSGAVPPVPGCGSMESDGGGIMSMSSAPSLSLSAKATPSGSKKRGSQSPIVISGAPEMTSAVLPVCVRKETFDVGVGTHNRSSSADSSLSIHPPDGTGYSSHTHSKKQRSSYEHNGSGHAVAARGSRPGPNGSRGHAEFHLSPNCAFDDCSVNSGSSASYYSNSYQ